MADEVAASPVVAAAPKKASKAKAAKPRPKLNHPKTSDMVMNAIKNLKERGGSSVQAIKKYISANYKVDVEKLSPFIKKYLKSAVASGALVQTKGKGATGSFKVVSNKEPKKVKTPAKSTKKAATASASGEKKSAAKKSVKKIKKAATPKKAAPAKSKAPKKEKKAKTPKKPKAPKPKKAAAKPKAKKAAPKKK